MEQYKYILYSHLHDNNDHTFSYVANKDIDKTSFAQRVAAVNQYIFGTETPASGQSVTLLQTHTGACATADHGFECIGLLLGNDQPTNKWDPAAGKPPSLGGCFRIPQASGSCWFVQPAVSIDLGVVKPGADPTAAQLLYSCQGLPPTYQVSLQGGGSSVEDARAGVSVGIKIGGDDLPARVRDTSPGARTLTLDLRPKLAQGATGDFRATGVLELAPE